MRFSGVGRRFSTLNGGQYDELGDFWDAMAERFGLETLCGLGWDWRDGSFAYAIGRIGEAFECPFPSMYPLTLELPDEGWERRSGETERLDQLYDEIYRDGPLTYEIERFFADGSCIVEYRREQN